MPRRPPAPIIEENSPSSLLGVLHLQTAQDDDAAVGANDAHEDHQLYQREGAAGSLQRKRRWRAWRESLSWSSSDGYRAEAPTRRADPARTEQNAVSPSVGAAKQADCGPQGPGHLGIATFPITAFSDERRAQRRARRRGRSWAAHCPARPYRVRRTRHRAPRSDQPSVRRAPTASSSGMLAMATPPTHPRSMRRARARNRSTRPPPTHAPMMVAMTLPSGRGARPGRALCMRQDEPWKREGRHPRCRSGRKVAANSVASGLYRRSLIPLRRAAPSPQRGTLRYPESRAKSA